MNSNLNSLPLINAVLSFGQTSHPRRTNLEIIFNIHRSHYELLLQSQP